MTVGKLAWLASSSAAAVAAFGLSEWPVPSVAGRSARKIKQLNVNIEKLQNIKMHGSNIVTVLNMFMTYSSWVRVSIMQTWNG